jgi:hypothetical protein
LQLCRQCLFHRTLGFSFVCSGIQTFNGSNQPQNTPTNDTRGPAQPAPHGTQNTTYLLTYLLSLLSQTSWGRLDMTILHSYALLILSFFIVGSNQKDDPYGIYEPVVEQSNLQGISLLYYRSIWFTYKGRHT